MADDNTEQVKLLFDYTKFHIGLYSTFASAVLALLAGTFADGWAICRTLLALSLLPIAIAGLAGGVIASSLPHMFGTKNILGEPIGPLMFEKWKLKSWTYLEHSSFWIAFLMAAAALVVPLISPNCCPKNSIVPKQTHVVIDAPRVKAQIDSLDVAIDPGGGSGTTPSQPTTTTTTSTGTSPPTGTTSTTLGGSQPPIAPPHPVPK